MKYELYPDYTIPPGATIQEWMDDSQVNHLDMAGRLEMSGSDLVNLLAGVTEITDSLAEKLEKVTQIPATMLTSLESSYRSKRAEIEKIQDQRRNIVVGVTVGLLEDLMEGASVGAKHGDICGQEWVDDIVKAIEFAEKAIDKIQENQPN